MQSSRFATALVGFLPSVVAHGFIEFPPLRAGTAGRDANAWCPHCGNGAGICGDGGQWGEKSDLLNFAPGPVTTLEAGKIADFSVKITAHHKGFFEFRICDKHLDGSLEDPQACLNQHLLVRSPPAADCKVNDDRGDCQPVDTRHPERWYLPPGAGTYKMKYEIPADLRCSSCTLQWQWLTANSCIPGEDTGCYWADLEARGWDMAGWCGDFCGRCSSLLQANSSSTVRAHSFRGCGEEFRNCADIAVVEDAGAITAPSTPSEAASPGTPQQTPSEAASPGTPQQTPSEAASPGTPQQASCSDVWGQCGGNGWQGPDCCTGGSSCVRQSEWYSQCKPGAPTVHNGDVVNTDGTAVSDNNSPVEQSPPASSEELQPTSSSSQRRRRRRRVVASSPRRRRRSVVVESSEPDSEPETEPEAESEDEEKDVSSSSDADDINTDGTAVSDNNSPVEQSPPASSEELQPTDKPLESSEPDSEPETEPEAESEDEEKDVSSSSDVPASSSMPASQCGSCRGCMKSDGECCMDASKSYCAGFSDNTWCGASSALLQKQKKQQQFLGLGLIQDGASRARGLVSDEL